MTDLQIVLIALGSTFLVGIVIYNKWHEYKTRKTVERAFTSTHDDVLMQPAAGAERQEPTLGEAAEPGGDEAQAQRRPGRVPARDPIAREGVRQGAEDRGNADEAEVVAHGGKVLRGRILRRT